jgi:hypothetical protein
VVVASVAFQPLTSQTFSLWCTQGKPVPLLPQYPLCSFNFTTEVDDERKIKVTGETTLLTKTKLLYLKLLYLVTDVLGELLAAEE